MSLLEELAVAAPPGQHDLSPGVLRHLKKLTAQLIKVRKEVATAEYERFLSVEKREICLPRLSARLGDAVVLVTGGTGCIGSALIRQLTQFHPARVVSISRGVTRCQGKAEYLRQDIRDASGLAALVAEISPDVIFHVAGQRNPGLAETEVHRTVTTNIMGTRNVMDAAASAGTGHVVFASTGKAIRPFSPEVYTASKRIAECLAAGMGSSAVRFTHVMDNSIIFRRLHDEGIIRLHSPDIAFYAQSALESAQLLLLSSLDEGGQVRVIRDLGFPFSLLDLALGVLVTRASGTPLYISGYDHGYEEVPFPGLYDPRTAGDVSPLANAFEAASMLSSACPMTDAFPVAGTLPREQLSTLEAVCDTTTHPDVIRVALRELSWTALDATLTTAPKPVLARVAAIAAHHPLGADYEKILQRMNATLLR